MMLNHLLLRKLRLRVQLVLRLAPHLISYSQLRDVQQLQINMKHIIVLWSKKATKRTRVNSIRFKYSKIMIRRINIIALRDMVLLAKMDRKVILNTRPYNKLLVNIKLRNMIRLSKAIIKSKRKVPLEVVWIGSLFNFRIKKQNKDLFS